MDAMQLFEKNLLSYDSRVGKSDKFYYNLPYVKDYDLCNSIPIAPLSGNVLKWYQYKVDEPVVIFTDVIDSEATELTEDAYDEDYDEFVDDVTYDEDNEDDTSHMLTDDEADALTANDDMTDDAISDEDIADTAMDAADDSGETIENDAPPIPPEGEVWDAPDLSDE